MWASQMGSFMAQSFQFLYSNVCCALCKRGKKRRAEAAARLRKERRIHERLETLALAEASKKLGEAFLEVGSPSDSVEKGSRGGVGDVTMTIKSPENTRSSMPIDSIPRNNQVNKTQNHPVSNHQIHNNIALTNNTDSGLQSQQSLDCSSGDRPVKIEILEPEMKEILENCAKYNLDQVKDPKDIAKSSEILEEIRNAEKVETMRREKESHKFDNNGSNNGVSKTPAASLPNSPQKVSIPATLDERSKNAKNGKLMVNTNGGGGVAMSDNGLPLRRGSNISMYDNSPESPLPPPNLFSIPNQQNDASLTPTNRASSSSGTPPSRHKATLGRKSSQIGLNNGSSGSSNQLIVSCNPDKNGATVTKILRSPGLPQKIPGKLIS